MTTTAQPSLPSTRAGASKVRGSELRSTDGFGEIDRKLSWLRNFLEMCEAGDDIVGSTPKSLALRADLKRQIADLENTRPTTAPVAPAHKCKPLSAQRAAGKLSSPNNQVRDAPQSVPQGSERARCESYLYAAVREAEALLSLPNT